jgi:putative spermidine/putrescine transport system substrate-binding protein
MNKISELNNQHSEDRPPKPDELVVMNWPLSSLWGNSLKETVSDVFTELTGISVRHEENTGLDFPPSFHRTLKKKNRPPFDVIYGNVIPALKLAQAGLCDPLHEEDFPLLKKLNKRAKPQAKGISGWPFVNVYTVPYAMMYREAAFPEKKPESWNIMLDPHLKGRVSIYPGGKGFYPVAQIMGGGSIEDIPHNMKPCWNFIRSLKPQMEHSGYNKEMTEYIRKGEVDIFFTALTNIRQWKKEGLGVSWAVPQEGLPDCEDSLLVPLYLPENVSYWAKQYIAFAMAEKSQRDFCYRLGTTPMYPGIEPPADLINDPVYRKSPDDLKGILYIPDSITVEYEADWMKKFNEIL